jgi:hypothetical protein
MAALERGEMGLGQSPKHLKTGKHSPSSLNRLINHLQGVLTADEQRLKLAARHVNGLIDHAPEILCKMLSVAAIGIGPIPNRIGLEKQRHHAANLLNTMWHTCVTCSFRNSDGQPFANLVEILIG